MTKIEGFYVIFQSYMCDGMFFLFDKCLFMS